MRHEFDSAGESGVLDPSVPWDIGSQSQRRRILDAMAKGCAEKTFAKMTIADIVENAAISRATFYKHFANKRECFEAAVGSFVGELQAAAIEAQAEADSPFDAVCKAAEAVLNLLASKPDHARLLVLEAPIVDPKFIGGCRKSVLDGMKALWGSRDGKPSGPDATIAYGRAQVLIAHHVAGGHSDRLPDLLPEMVYIALLPVVGQEEALENAQSQR